MILTRTPFRVSFLGGGTDLPDYYRRRPGCVLSATISKYMFIAIHPFFYRNKIQLKYSQTELVEDPAAIRHPILRAVVQRFGLTGVDINSIADIPSGTGLGSSSAFAVGLLHAVYAHQGRYVSRQRLAEEACAIEIDELKEPIGKQDQYASAFGGLNTITFHSDESVQVEPIIMQSGKQKELESRLMLFFTGMARPANQVLREQRKNTVEKPEVFEALGRLAAMAAATGVKLANGDTDSLGLLLHEGWLLKQQLAQSITTEGITALYATARRHGAIGGKLLGAGGGGFLLLYVYPDAQQQVRESLGKLQEVKLMFDNGGTQIIHAGDPI